MKWMGGIQVVMLAACGLYVGYMIRFAYFILVCYTFFRLNAEKDLEFFFLSEVLLMPLARLW